MKTNAIAIDGPAASGKSSVAKGIAKRFNAIHINTGSMYRAVALKSRESGISPENSPEDFASLLKNTEMKFVMDGNASEPELMVDGVFPGEKLRSDDISRLASKLSAIPAVRARLVELQRAMAGEQLLVMEGRDIGTVVFPDAKYKFFLTASPEARAKRRLIQDGEPLTQENLSEIAASIAERDLNDSRRAIAPLKQADDAILVDNTNMTLEETVDFIASKIV